MVRNIKKLLVCFLILVSFLSSMLASNITHTKAFIDIPKIVMCKLGGETGEFLLKLDGQRTDYLPYLLYSKSNIGGSNRYRYDINNLLLRTAGFKIGGELDEELSAFERFGMSGLIYTSYRGEFKYSPIDVCSKNPEVKSTNLGQYYSTRKEPLTSYGERHSTGDNRVRLFASSKGRAFQKAIVDGIANTVLNIAKFLTTITLSLIGLAFSDISEIFGIGFENRVEIIKKLHENLFMPLCVFMFLLTGIYIGYQGLIKRNIRQGVVGGVIKTVASMLVALLLVINPSILKAPKVLVSVLENIVISSMIENVEDVSDDLCNTPTKNIAIQDINSTLEELNTKTKSLIGCKMWSEFFVRPFIKSQFGTEYTNLKDYKADNSTWTGSPIVKLGGDRKINNLGLMYISVLSGVHRPIDDIESPYINGVHKDYFRIVDMLSNYEERIIYVDGIDGAGLQGIHITAIRGSALSTSYKKAFLDRITPIAKTIAKQYNIPVATLIAQAALESNWGRSGLATKDNNYFGIKCNKRVKSCSNWGTTEEYGGQKQKVKADFAHYESLEESVKDYAILLSTSNYYKHAIGSADWAEYISKIAGTYATDSRYASKVANVVVSANLDEIEDTYNKNVPDFDKINEEVERGSDETETAETDNLEEALVDLEAIPSNAYVEALETTPKHEWLYFTGNKNNHRIGDAFLMLLLSIMGSFLPLVFALMSATIGLGIDILMIFIPIFLLIGCVGGRGHEILMQYIGLLCSLIVKKLVATFFLVISIILVTITMNLINDVGLVHALITMPILVFVLFKNRKSLIEKASDIGMPKLNTQGFNKGIQILKSVTRGTATATAIGVSGGIAAKKNGGTFSAGVRSSLTTQFKDSLYRTEIGRRSMNAYETMSEKVKDEHAECMTCGKVISDGEQYYIDNYGNPICEECASISNFEDMTMSTMEDRRTDLEDMVKDKEAIDIYDISSGKRVKKQHITYKELSSLGYNKYDKHKLSKNLDNIFERIDDSKQIVKQQLESIKKENKKIGNPFIPEPLRAYISPKSLNKLKGTKSYDEYYNIIENGFKMLEKDILSQTHK